MNIHEATEQAYKNGYEAGVREFAERLKDKSIVARTCDDSKFELVVTISNIDTIAKELTGKDKDNDR